MPASVGIKASPVINIAHSGIGLRNSSSSDTKQFNGFTIYYRSSYKVTSCTLYNGNNHMLTVLVRHTMPWIHYLCLSADTRIMC